MSFEGPDIKLKRDNVKSAILYIIFLLSGFIIYSKSFLENGFNLSSFMLFFISLYSCLVAVYKNHPDPYSSLNFEKWLLIYVSIFILFLCVILGFYNENMMRFCFLLSILSFVSYFGGKEILYKVILPCTVMFLIILNYDSITYWLSYPVRLICTKLTVSILHYLGMNIISETTIIIVGSKKVAITAACSGLVLIETLIWIGWIIVKVTYESSLKKILHYILIVPIVFFTNTLRLMILVVLYHHFGEIVIISPLHLWLGYLMVVAACLLFYFSKNLFVEGGMN